MEAAVVEPAPRKGRKDHEDSRGDTNASRCRNNLDLRLGTAAAENGLDVGDCKGGGCADGTIPRYIIAQEGPVIHQREGLGLGGSKRCFSETTGGFVHPWSLAARQEKAALEQAHQKTSPCSTVSSAPAASTWVTAQIIGECSGGGITQMVKNAVEDLQNPVLDAGPVHPPRVVGWPPIRSFRRNLGFQNPPKFMINSKEKLEEIKVITQENRVQEKPTKFVKVNMEGCSVGRKIDLNLYNGYDSLSHALQKMFHNFFSVNYLNNPKQDERDEVVSPCYILLYEDDEGDRMLVGDVPWELFINSVKRLYITLDPRACKCG